MIKRTQCAKYLAIFTVAMSLYGCILDDAVLGPVVSFTNPANATKIQTPDFLVNIVGTATSGSNIVSVDWVNDRGGRGTAIGTETWNTGNILLDFGTNNITVTATDSVGLSDSKSIAIERENTSLGAGTGTATLSWNPPTERVDNSHLTDLAGYEIHYGRSSGSYTNHVEISNPGLTAYVVDNLETGTWYFSISALDSNNQLSDFSSEGQLNVL